MKIYRRQLAGVRRRLKSEPSKIPSCVQRMCKVPEGTPLKYQLTEVNSRNIKIDLLTCEILRSNIGKAKSFLVFG